MSNQLSVVGLLLWSNPNKAVAVTVKVTAWAWGIYSQCQKVAGIDVNVWASSGKPLDRLPVWTKKRAPVPAQTLRGICCRLPAGCVYGNTWRYVSPCSLWMKWGRVADRPLSLGYFEEGTTSAKIGPNSRLCPMHRLSTGPFPDVDLEWTTPPQYPALLPKPAVCLPR